MVSALLGEAAEVTQCVMGIVSNNEPAPFRENMVEELGDLRFYCVGIPKAAEFAEPLTAAEIQAFDIAFDAADRGSVAALAGVRWREATAIQHFTMAADVVSTAGDLFDVVKQYVIYNKPFDRVATEVALQLMQDAMKTVQLIWQITDAEIEEYNRRKLKLRYEKLVYSDQAAVARADKA